MRLATARVADGTTAVVATTGGWVRLPYPDVGALLAVPGALDAARSAGDPHVEPDGLAPVVPHPSKIVCCGHNYAGHIRELGRPRPEHPTLFAKWADTLTGPADVVTVPAHATGLDWEAELAVVVAAPPHRATPDGDVVEVELDGVGTLRTPVHIETGTETTGRGVAA